MAWGSKATLTGLNTALSETTNSDSDYVAANHYTQWDTLNPGETVQLQIEVVFGSTGNDIAYRTIASEDATSEVADTIALTAGSIPFVASTTQRRTITLSNVYKYRVELRKYGTTSGSYTPNVFAKKNGISV
jgi:hypothetical protein